MGRLRAALQEHTVYIDTNVFIYAIEIVKPWDYLAQDVFAGLKQNEFSAVTSDLTLSECLVFPLCTRQKTVGWVGATRKPITYPS